MTVLVQRFISVQKRLEVVTDIFASAVSKQSEPEMGGLGEGWTGVGSGLEKLSLMHTQRQYRAMLLALPERRQVWEQ